MGIVIATPSPLLDTRQLTPYHHHHVAAQLAGAPFENPAPAAAAPERLPLFTASGFRSIRCGSVACKIMLLLDSSEVLRIEGF